MHRILCNKLPLKQTTPYDDIDRSLLEGKSSLQHIRHLIDLEKELRLQPQNPDRKKYLEDFLKKNKLLKEQILNELLKTYAAAQLLLLRKNDKSEILGLGGAVMIGRNIALTSADNLYMINDTKCSQPPLGWLENITVYPGTTCGQQESSSYTSKQFNVPIPFGSYPIEQLYVTQGWINSNGLSVIHPYRCRHNFGIIVFNQNIGDDTGFVGMIAQNIPRTFPSQENPLRIAASSSVVTPPTIIDTYAIDIKEYQECLQQCETKGNLEEYRPDIYSPTRSDTVGNIDCCSGTLGSSVFAYYNGFNAQKHPYITGIVSHFVDDKCYEVLIDENIIRSINQVKKQHIKPDEKDLIDTQVSEWLPFISKTIEQQTKRAEHQKDLGIHHFIKAEMSHLVTWLAHKIGPHLPRNCS